MSPENALSAFHSMWDLFPEPVMLLHRNRTILATNDLGRRFGIPVGGRCHQLNPDAGGQHCRQCRATEALRTGQAVTSPSEKNGMPLTAFWIPVQGEADLYIHFGIGTRALRETMTPTAPAESPWPGAPARCPDPPGCRAGGW